MVQFTSRFTKKETQGALKNIKIKTQFTYLFLLAFFISCKKENAFDCLKSNGPETTITRDLGTFRTIQVFDKIELDIKQGPEFKVELTAGKNLLSNISSVNKNGVLTLKNNNRCNFVRGYKRNVVFTITVPKIDTVENRGVGTIRFAEGFTQETIFILAENSGDTHLNGAFQVIKTGSHGNGDIYISGTCKELFVYTYGTNSFRGENLTVSNYVFIETISIGDCHVNAPGNGVLECRIWRAGNIYYKGNPAEVNDFSDGSAKGMLIKE